MLNVLKLQHICDICGKCTGWSVSVVSLNKFRSCYDNTQLMLIIVGVNDYFFFVFLFEIHA